MRKILVTGCKGQIGTELISYLIELNGRENVIGSDIREPSALCKNINCYELIDVTDADRLMEVIENHNIGNIYHLAAILSAVGEKKPQLAWEVNMNGLFNILEAARESDCTVFVPSSIAAFGPDTPKDNTPQDTLQRPTSMYGVTKVGGELLCDYYHLKYGLDVRGVRFPGLISYKAPPGGGTTDYAVDIFYEAIKKKEYNCFLKQDTRLDMMYMPDAIKAMVDVMNADPARLKHRNAFNITALSFTPDELTVEIQKHIPDFKINYNIDPVRQAIADSWPNSMDDSVARQEWDWSPSWNMAVMTEDMLKNLRLKLKSD